MLILGLLSEGPKNGYEIHQKAKYTVNLFWSELKFGHIYPALQKLERQQYIAIHDTSNLKSGRKSTSYKITESGIQVLNSWIEFNETKDTMKSETLAKLFFSTNENLSTQYHRIELMKEESQTNFEVLIQQQQNLQNLIQQNPDAFNLVYQSIVLEFGLIYYSGLQKLTEKSLALLEKAQNHCNNVSRIKESHDE